MQESLWAVASAKSALVSRAKEVVNEVGLELLR